MWKKVVAAALSMTLVLAMGTAVNAAESPSATPAGSPSATPAGSPSAPSIEAGGVKALTKDVTVMEFSSNIIYDSNEELIKSDAGIKEILGNNYKKGTTLDLLAYVELYKSTASFKDEGGQVQVAIDKVAKGDTIYVLHYKEDQSRTVYDPESHKYKVYGTWEVITPDAVGDGTVTFTSNSFSPFAFVKATSATPEKTLEKTPEKTPEKTTAATGTNTTKKASTTVKKSPKTGEF